MVLDGNTNRLSAIGSVTWARTQRLCRRDLRVPIYKAGTPTEMPESDRVELVARLLHDDTIPTVERVAGLLVALYAQPVTRICTIRREAITRTIDGTYLHIGGEHLELAPPLATLIDQLPTDHPDLAPGPWLFPGNVAGQPLTPHGLGQRLRTHGVTRAARIAAFHDLVHQVPSPVLAELIGYNPVVIANRANTLATPWHHYAALRAAH